MRGGAQLVVGICAGFVASHWLPWLVASAIGLGITFTLEYFDCGCGGK